MNHYWMSMQLACLSVCLSCQFGQLVIWAKKFEWNAKCSFSVTTSLTTTLNVSWESAGFDKEKKQNIPTLPTLPVMPAVGMDVLKKKSQKLSSKKSSDRRRWLLIIRKTQLSHSARELSAFGALWWRNCGKWSDTRNLTVALALFSLFISLELTRWL